MLFTVCTDRLYIDLTPVERRRGICFQLGHVQIRSVKGSSQIPVHVPCSYEGVKKLCRAMMASTWLHTVGQTSRMRLGVPSSSHMLHRVGQLCGPGQIDDLDVRRWQFHLQAIEISDLPVVCKRICRQSSIIHHNPGSSRVSWSLLMRNTTYHGHRILGPGWSRINNLKNIYLSRVSWMKNLASYRPRQVRQVKLRGEIIADLPVC